MTRSNFDENCELEGCGQHGVSGEGTEFPMNSTKGEADLEQTEASECFVNVLAQGCYDSVASNTLGSDGVQPNHQEQDESSDHVTIQCNDENLSKVRSQFMHR